MPLVGSGISTYQQIHVDRGSEALKIRIVCARVASNESQKAQRSTYDVVKVSHAACSFGGVKN